MPEDAINKLAVGFALAELLALLEPKVATVSRQPQMSVSLYLNPEEWEKLTRALGVMRSALGE